jgi:SAM-dependent methyltransferase
VRHVGTTPAGHEIVSCAICDSVDVRELYIKFDVPLVECRRCGLVFVSPRPPREIVFQRYNPRYFDEEYLPAHGVVNGHVDPAFIDARYSPMLALIERYVPAKGRLFEVGVGAGLFLGAAARRGWAVSGIDLSPTAAAFARNRLGLNVTECSAETMPRDVEPFDVVVMFDVIEHFFDPIVVLRTIRSILRQGGILVVATPNYHALSRLALGQQWAILSPFEHMYYFSEATLRHGLHEAGFTDVQYARRFPGWSVLETMNAQHTHAPASLRAAFYRWSTARFGPLLHRTVQAAGKGDVLLAISRRGGP